jgi:hypothetical protein
MAEPRFGDFGDKSATSRRRVGAKSAPSRRQVGAKSAKGRRRSAPDMCGGRQPERSALVGKFGGGRRRFGDGRRQVGVKSATVGDKSATVGAHHTWLRQPRGSAEVGDGRRRSAPGRRLVGAVGRRRGRRRVGAGRQVGDRGSVCCVMVMWPCLCVVSPPVGAINNRDPPPRHRRHRNPPNPSTHRPQTHTPPRSWARRCLGSSPPYPYTQPPAAVWSPDEPSRAQV